MAKAKAEKTTIDLNKYKKALEIFDDGLESAVLTIIEIMKNQEINPATRLQAAQTLFSNISKVTEVIQQEEARLEQAARREAERQQAIKDKERYKGMDINERLNAQLADLLNSL